MAAVWPALPSVQVIFAAVGDVVGVVLLQDVNVSAAEVGWGFTVRLTAVDAAEPAGVGVAVSAPE